MSKIANLVNLLNALQVQQLAAAWTVCWYFSWLTVRELIYFHTALQAHNAIRTGQPMPMFVSISTDHPRDTRSAEIGHIRFQIFSTVP